MNFLLRIWAIFFLAARRLVAQRWLALATALGLVVSIALIMSIPLYSDAVYYRILHEELAKTNEGQSLINRPAFAFMYRYLGSIYGTKKFSDAEAVDTYLSGPAVDQLGIPVGSLTRYLKSDTLRMFPAGDAVNSAFASTEDPLEWVSFGSATNFENHVNFVAGAMPAPASANPDEPVEVAVTQVMADKFGIQPGEEYMLFRTTKAESGSRTVQIPVRVSGIWNVTDSMDEYWFYAPTSFDTQLIIPEASFRGRIASLFDDEFDTFMWYWIADGSDVNVSNADRLVSRIDQIRQRAATLLPNTKLEISPYDALRDYQQSSGLLNLLLYAFSIPIVSLLIAFIGLVVGLSVARQRNEIAVMRSRGATALQIISIALVEAMILVAVALAIGAPVSTWLAYTIGATKSFLNFTLEPDLRVQLTSTALGFGLAAGVATLLAQVLPSLGASRHTIISYKQELARTIRPPWWQRAWLDVLLMIPVGYGVYLLRQQGSLVTPGAPVPTDMFDNPLLFLLPALTAFALTLLVLRLLPLMMAVLAWLAARTSSVGFLLAMRYLARDPGFYTTPLVLLMLTLGLAVYTASLAQTLDNHLFDKNYYAVGADAQLNELGQSNAPSNPYAALGAQAEAAATTPGSTVVEPEWVFIPVSEHLTVDEIAAATRVGTFQASVQVKGKWQASQMLGIDRVDFPKVAYWRRDFAPASLGALMNSLAIANDGLLAERSFLRANGLRVGDQVQVLFQGDEEKREVPMRIMGDFSYFPTWYTGAEENVALLVGNLEFIFEQMGGEQPYDVWIKTTPPIDFEEMKAELRTVEINVMGYDAAAQRIGNEQRRPERQGLFGVLSVGFLASAVLTVLGFLLYALFSFRRRFIELGTLRAIGLSTRQLGIFLVCELAFLIILGLSAGTWIGITISDLFIPYLQIGAGPTANTPPFVVEIAWFALTRLYILFGALFVAAFSVLIVLLMRMKVFEAIKLGETV